MLLLGRHSPQFLKRGIPPTGLEITNQAKLAGQRAFGISLLYGCVTLVLQVCTITRGSFTLVPETTNSSPCIIKTSTLPNETSPHSSTMLNKLEGSDI